MRTETIILGLLLVSVSYAAREFEEFVERHQHLIPKEKVDQLFREKRGSNQHWCCKEDTSIPVTVQRTRIVTAYKEGYYMVKVGETNCGTFGWSSCTLYGTRTHLVSHTYMTQYDLDLDRECKSHQLVCCPGYVLLNKQGGNNCFNLKDLDAEQKDLLTRLHGYDGLLGGRRK